MKVWAGVIGLFVASSALANPTVTFDQYEAVVEAGATHAERCKREVRMDDMGDRCTRFFEYMRSNSDITRGFLERAEQEGDVVFDGVSTSRRVAHRHYRQQLTADMAYITEMLQ